MFTVDVRFTGYLDVNSIVGSYIDTNQPNSVAFFLQLAFSSKNEGKMGILFHAFDIQIAISKFNVQWAKSNLINTTPTIKYSCTLPPWL